MREAATFIASHGTTGSSGLLGDVANAARHAFQAWANRRKLATLSEFDDHLLEDIGLTREDVRAAFDVPFSQDPSLEMQRRALHNRRAGWGAY